MRKRALIIGIGGQDGSYLAEHLLARGYTVVGAVRPSVRDFPERILHLRQRIALTRMELLDDAAIAEVLREVEPDEVYNFAGVSFVPASRQQPALTAEYNGTAVGKLLEAIRLTNPSIRFYQASSSEMFGRPASMPQSESTPFDPHNPYAVAKLYAHHMTESYRHDYGLFAVSGILYNHESPRRGQQFVTRKITQAAAAIAKGLSSELRLGDLGARRDWGFAGDYVDVMWRMLQQDLPETFVVATGLLHTVQDVVEAAFASVDLDWRDYVVTDGAFLRPDDDTACLLGDARRARERLGWTPKVDFEELIRTMVDADLSRVERGSRYDPALDWPAGRYPFAALHSSADR